MYIIERLIGVFVYSLLLFVFCILISHSKAKTKTVFFWYVVFLAFMAALYKPSETGDLYRTFKTIKWYSTFPFLDFFEMFVKTSAAPSSRILYWLIGKTGVPRLLPIVSTICCYYCIFYIICKTQDLFQISNRTVATILFFIMSSSIYISVIGGIRMMLSISVICYCGFREGVEKKRSLFQYLLLAIGVLMHSMGVVLLAMYIFSTVFVPDSSVLIRVLKVLFLVLVAIFLSLTNGIYVSEIAEKANKYIVDSGFSDNWEYIMGIDFFVIIVYLLVVYNRQIRRYDSYSGIQTMVITTVICLFVGLTFFASFSVFYRFIGHVAVIFSIPMIMLTVEHASPPAMRTRYYIHPSSVLLLGSILIYIISISRGSLSSLKFFVIR